MVVLFWGLEFSQRGESPVHRQSSAPTRRSDALHRIHHKPTEEPDTRATTACRQQRCRKQSQIKKKNAPSFLVTVCLIKFLPLKEIHRVNQCRTLTLAHEERIDTEQLEWKTLTRCSAYWVRVEKYFGWRREFWCLRIDSNNEMLSHGTR